MSDAVLNKIRELDAEKSTLVEAAKDEAMAEAVAAIDVLRELGFHYLILAEDEHRPNGGRGGSRKPRADKLCPICKFQTIPPHDGRHHRNQTPKAPFNGLELEEKGLVRSDETADSSDETTSSVVVGEESNDWVGQRVA